MLSLSIQKKGSFYTLREEIANAITHGLGAGLSIAGLVVLLLKAAGDPWKTVSASIYGSSMILLFIMSCLYHALTNERAKKVFRVFDHTTIFLLIAGTYTPFTLITLRGIMGWSIFGAVWGVAVTGIILNTVSIERFKKISMAGYVVSGWCILAAMVPLVQRLDLPGLLLLFLGGIFYTGGIFFYKKKGAPYWHMIWHLFVLAGAVCHFFCIILYVV
ncbi:MAG: hemolysin III family protein [Clostridiales bacterium]|nr:hemolysin III family protein [Clostridiales bacterium]